MADPPTDPNAREQTSDTGTPRWVKVFGIIALVVILLFVILLLIGPGGHGPGMHTSFGGGVATPQLAKLTDPGNR